MFLQKLWLIFFVKKIIRKHLSWPTESVKSPKLTAAHFMQDLHEGNALMKYCDNLSILVTAQKMAGKKQFKMAFVKS